MPRIALGPRLYLDPIRRTWAIRDGKQFVRLGLAESERGKAEKALQSHMSGGAAYPIHGERVYFLRAGNKVKIGRTRNVQARIDALQNMNPVRLHLLFAQPGGVSLERSYHQRFKAYRAHGEWFEIRGDLADFLSRYVTLKRANLCHGTVSVSA